MGVPRSARNLPLVTRYSSLLVDDAVEPLVVEAAAHRHQLLADLLLGCGHTVALERLLVGPDLDHRHVVGTADLRQRVEALVARALAPGFRGRFSEGAPVA